VGELNILVLTIGGIGVPFLVVGIVETAKRWGLPKGRPSEILAFVIAIGLTGLAVAIHQNMIPAAALPWILLCSISLAGGLTATGYYDLLKRLATLKPPDESEE